MADDAGRVRAPPLPAPVRERSRAGADAPRLHRRALPRATGRGAPHGARPRRVDRHHRRLPGRDRRRLRAHARGGGRGRVRLRLHVHLLASPRHRGGRADRALRRSGRRRRALPAPQDRHRAIGDHAPPGPRRPRRGGPGRRPVEEEPGADLRAHAPEQARPLRAAEPIRTGQLRRRSRSPEPRRTTSRVASSSSSPNRRTRSASQSPRCDRRARAGSPSSGRPASGKSAVALAVAEQVGDVELVSIDSMQVYRGMDIGTAKPTPAERSRGAASPARPRRSGSGLHRRRVPARVSATARRSRRARSRGRSSSAARASITGP